VIPVTRNKAGEEGDGDTEMVDGLLLKFPITDGCTTGVVGFVGWGGIVIQPGIKIRNNNSARERKTNFFILCTS
jgi:hypothetical protein